MPKKKTEITHETLHNLRAAAHWAIVENIVGPGTPSAPYQKALSNLAEAAKALYPFH